MNLRKGSSLSSQRTLGLLERLRQNGSSVPSTAQMQPLKPALPKQMAPSRSAWKKSCMMASLRSKSVVSRLFCARGHALCGGNAALAPEAAFDARRARDTAGRRAGRPPASPCPRAPSA